MTSHSEKLSVADTMVPTSGGSLLRKAIWLVGICVLAGAAGFGFFLSEVNGFRDIPVSGSRADGIVVLTGGYARLEPAVALLLAKRGERLLVSGVNEHTSKDTLRNALAIDEKTFECCVDIDRAALDTTGNADQTARWTQTRGGRRYAMPRRHRSRHGWIQTSHPWHRPGKS